MSGAALFLLAIILLELAATFPAELEDVADELELRELRYRIQAERFASGELVVLELEGGVYWIGPRGGPTREAGHAGGARPI